MTYLQYLLDKSCAKRLPVSGTMELTGRCNFSCKMCYIHQTGCDTAEKELTTAQWLAIAQQLQQAGTLTMLLTGGEPLLRSDFSEIYLNCKRLGLLLSVNTNGSLLTPVLFDMLRKSKPLVLNISLYGASEETYCRLCGVKGMFDRVSANLRELKRLEIPVKINYTVTEENFDDRDAIYAFARENGFHVGQTTYLFPPARIARPSCTYARVSPERAAELLFACERCHYPAAELQERLLRRPAPTDDCGTLPDGKAPRTSFPTDGQMHCRAGVSSYWVTYDGTLQACGMLPSPAVNLTQTPFSEAWRQLRAGRDAIRLPKKCTACRLRETCEICAAICASEGGFDTPPDYICKKTQRYGALAAAYLREKNDAME